MEKLSIADSAVRAFLRDAENVVALHRIAEYSYALILPKSWIDLYTEEIEMLHLVRLTLQPGTDNLLVEPITQRKLDVLLNTIKRKEQDDRNRRLAEDNQGGTSYDEGQG